MIIPVRCFTCGKVLADKWEAYVLLCSESDASAGGDGAAASRGGGDRERPGPDGKTSRGRILDGLGVTRCCCRTAMMTHVDLSLVI
jgi:DNA-directed RNA polymerase I, II, and III subunit RPABC5